MLSHRSGCRGRGAYLAIRAGEKEKWGGKGSEERLLS